MTRTHRTTMYLILFVFLSACNSNSHDFERLQKEKEVLEKENELLKKENELLRMQQHQDSIAINNMAEDTTALATEEQLDDAPPESSMRVGKHSFSLQWIGWEKPGEVEITHLKNNKYKIVGEQKSNETDDYVTIDGELTMLSEKRLLFEGKLVSQVSYINGGQPCIREEPLHFRATGSRKYWRLEEKQSCEGGMTVEYVDIYF